MALFPITNFKGEIPRITPTLLPEGFAVTAEGARLEDGALAPTREHTLVETLDADAQTIYRHAGDWIAWDAHVNVVTGHVSADRLYLTGNGVPKVRFEGTEYPLALPAPTAAPTLTPAGTLDEDTATDVQYVYTYVTELDEESAPSPLSDSVEYSSGITVTVSGLVDPGAGRLIDRIRIYRTQVSALGTTDLYFVAEVDADAGSFVHDVVTHPLQETLATLAYDVPPDGLTGIVSMPNGMMAAFSGRELFFSEPYVPHAWPRSYTLKTDAQIVGLAAFGTTLAIMTEGTPYTAQGTHPDSMVMAKIEENLPCTAARGIVDLGYAAAYPSTNGLVLVSGSGAQLVSKSVFTLEQWWAMRPATFTASHHNGRYIVSYDAGFGRKTLALDLTGDQPFVVRHEIAGTFFFNDLPTGNLFFLDGDRDIKLMDDLWADRATYTWHSKPMKLPYPDGFGALKVDADSLAPNDTFCLNIYADGELLHSVARMNEIVRIPAGRLYTKWSVEVIANVEITAIYLAHSPSDFGLGG
ncbi:hypothetical protein [Maritimibacter sp. DP1N21-5]|uniref:hypothetical protein n=1 Tax=Maritimibacter sp. DP1N21-5 TaxID=2836867 RepID=UPI001C4634E8|nr:hypothetical protein [Maritimibacter sp. DP1N21-5]MBV7408767.1 hypothetical protein [Maritimibacter sp. DP1N21-5]